MSTDLANDIDAIMKAQTKDENHNFKDTGVKKIKQEIINLSKAEIQLENISIKCENII